MLLLMFFCSCDVFNENNNDSNSVPEYYILGNLEEYVEVNTEYQEKGVVYPENCTMVTAGYLNTAATGTYQLIYRIYDQFGELKKELSRYINVVDTTAPTYTKVSNAIYYAGITYQATDFITYCDNYSDNRNITLSTSSITFYQDGSQQVEITLTDENKNSITYTDSFNVLFDFEKLVDSKHIQNVTKTTASQYDGSTTQYIIIRINNKDQLSYFGTGSIHYSEQVSTNLVHNGYASIQISATKYGDFYRADVNYHISATGGSYSVGFATIDATQKYDSLTISRFSSTINNLGLDEQQMLSELNEQLVDVLNDFQNYMENTLGIIVK